MILICRNQSYTQNVRQGLGLKHTLPEIKEIANKAALNAQNVSSVQYIERELLQPTLLEPLLNTTSAAALTFQGGTALRLCYASPRFSEDLDFACGTDTSLIDIDDISSTIESFLKGQYGKDASLKTPSSDIWDSTTTDSMKIPKWFGKFNLNPSRRDVALQKVKLEIAPVPAHSHTFMQPINHYTSYGFESKLPPIKVESIDEIMADKILALAMAPYPRYRDIWDMAWIAQSPAYTQKPLSFLPLKIHDYKIEDFPEQASATIKSLSSLLESPGYLSTMQTLLPHDVFCSTVADPASRKEALFALSETFQAALSYLREPSFPTVLKEKHPEQETSQRTPLHPRTKTRSCIDDDHSDPH